MDPFRGEPSESTISYEPANVKDLLVEMKNTAELLIDLSYSALLSADKQLAREVLALEERMDRLELRAGMSLLMAARNPHDAERLAPVIGIVAATDAISDAAGDIAKIILDDIGVPPAIRTALPAAGQPLVRATVAADSTDAGKTLGALDLESSTGVRVVAVRTDDDWQLTPGPQTVLPAGAVILLRGPVAGVTTVYNRLTGQSYTPPASPTDIDDDLDRAIETIMRMKELSELAVDLAYSSVLFDSEPLAEEVRNIEVEVDSLQSRFEAWVLEAAGTMADPVSLRGLLQLSVSTEMISDAAIDISRGVFRDIDVHPVVHLAVRESDELLVRVEVTPGSTLEGVVVEGGLPNVDPTMQLIAIRRPSDGWILIDTIDDKLKAGDVLIAKGTRRAADMFRDYAEH